MDNRPSVNPSIPSGGPAKRHPGRECGGGKGPLLWEGLHCGAPVRNRLFPSPYSECNHGPTQVRVVQSKFGHPLVFLGAAGEKLNVCRQEYGAVGRMYVLRSSFAMGIYRGGNKTRLRAVKSRTEARDSGPIWDTWGYCRCMVGDQTVWVFVVCYGIALFPW